MSIYCSYKKLSLKELSGFHVKLRPSVEGSGLSVQVQGAWLEGVRSFCKVEALWVVDNAKGLHGMSIK